MNAQELAAGLLDLMGGPENIESITHCATRLRVALRDQSRARIGEIEALAGVQGVISAGKGLQVVLGLGVGKVCEAMRHELAASGEGGRAAGSSSAAPAGPSADTPPCAAVPGASRGEGVAPSTFQASGARRNASALLSRFIETVVGIFSPLLAVLAGSGLIRGITILVTELGFLDEASTTHALLFAMTSAVFYFFPILVAVSSARRFKANPYVAAAVMGTFILPDFLAYVQEGGGNLVGFFGVDAPVFDYSGQVLPAIISTYIQSKLEAVLEAWLPTSLHLTIVPTVSIFAMTLATLYVVGPAGNYVSIGIARGVAWLSGLNPILTGAFCGGIWNVLILFGVHWAPNTMVIIPQIAQTGSSPFIAYGANANFGMAGAALAVAMRTKSSELRGFSFSAIASVMLSGIVEPAIYGLGVRFKTPLVAGCLGAALGGAFMGAFGVTGNAFVFGGLTTIPAFAGPTLAAYVAGIAISFVAGAVLTLVIGVDESEVQRG